MWYAVELLFERIHPDSAKNPDDLLWEQSIFLIQALDEEEAKAKAENVAKKEELSYRAISGETVKWRFVKLTGTYQILQETLTEGTEVFSRFLRSTEVKGFLKPFEK